MENILKISSQILMLVGFFIFFIGLLASPIIYINIKQHHFFKKLKTKYQLTLMPPKHFIRRDFPFASGKINDKNIFIEATKLGEFYYNLHFDTYRIHFNTYKFSSPVVKLGVEFNNTKIKKIALVQKKMISSQYISEFDDYFTLEVEPKEFKTKIFNNSVKQNIMNYSRKNQSYLNLFLDNSYLVNISNFELTNDKKYNQIIDKLSLMLSISKNR